ncbi:MAG: ABC transporter substrate-binding protein [Gemmatimonadota bacterium]
MSFLRLASPMKRPSFSLTLAAFVAGACAGESAKAPETGGTVVIAALGEAEHLFPPLIASAGAKQIVDQIFDFLAEPSPDLNTVGDVGFRPRLASRWSWSADSSSVTFEVDSRARWHDGRPVSARDVRFSIDLYRDPVVRSPIASALPAIDSIVVVDSLLLRVHFSDRNPERFYRVVYNVLVLPAHILEGGERSQIGSSPFTREPIGSGPFRLAGWEKGVSIELVANEGYHLGPPSLDRLLWRIVPDVSAGTQSVAAGESDFVESIRPEAMALASRPNVKLMEYPSFLTGVLLFNTRSQADRNRPHPVLGEPAVRRALSMAIDRSVVVGNAFDSLARVLEGPFPLVYWSADTTIDQQQLNLAAATASLDSLGWRDSDGDGFRDRNGRPLRLTVLVPSVSNSRRQMAVVLQDQLRRAGIEVVVDAMEPAALFPRLTQGKFDAFIHAWLNDPSPSSISQTFGGRDLQRSSNLGWYVNARVDSLIERAALESDRRRARALYRDIYQTIVSDAPAVFLWEPRNFALMHSRLETAGVRGDAWWAGLSRWRVAPGRKIPRDQIASRQ